MPKIVLHHANIEHPERCFVQLFKHYHSLCPPDAPQHAFYLQPSRTPISSCWYTNKPLGHTTLGKTISRLCKSAGIEGFRTNHSLRATATTRLYQAGVDEQLVMERTGHRSVDGVRCYKRTNDKQREALSDIINTTPAWPLTTSAQSTAFQSNSHGLSLPSATFQNCTINFHVGSGATTSTIAKRRQAVIYDSDSD